MRILLQKVSEAHISVEKQEIAAIKTGYLLYLGVISGDSEQQAADLAAKICSLRLFHGEDGKINNRSIVDIHGEIAVVSQFTLAGRTQKGNRPDYTLAETPDRARALYDQFIVLLKQQGVKQVSSGEFGAHMHVSSVNDGPVTLIIER